MRIKAFITAEQWAPLDKRWCATCKIGGRTIGAFGVSRETAIDELKQKVVGIEAETD